MDKAAELGQKRGLLGPMGVGVWGGGWEWKGKHDNDTQTVKLGPTFILRVTDSFPVRLDFIASDFLQDA